MPAVYVRENKMMYWTSGRNVSGKERALVFIHGAGGNRNCWVFQKAFFEKDFIPLMIDLPGHGESDGDGEDSIERYAGRVYDLLEGLKLQQVFLIGHSMGGAIAQTLALKNPERIQGIVLVGTGAKLRVLPAVMEGLQRDFPKAVRNLVRSVYSPKASPDLVEGGIELLMKCRPQVLYGDFVACDTA